MRKQFYLPRLVLLTTLVILIINTFAQTCPTGLVSYWKMDETYATILTDYHGGHNATRNIVTGTASGKINNSQHFTYTVNTDNNAYTYSEYATVPHNSAFDFPSNSSFTISYWCKFNDWGYGFQDHIVISKGEWNGGASYPDGMWGSGINGSGKINFLLRDNTGVAGDLEGPNMFQDGLWHHVACVRDGSTNKSYIYVDGNITAQATYYFTGNFSTAMNIELGCLVSGGARKYFYKGDADEIAIYNRALSSTEISNQIISANTGVGICDGLNPNISSIPNTKAVVGSLYNYLVHAGGLQTGMTYSLFKNPAGMTINSTTGLISWTPASIFENTLVSVIANNDVAPADTQTFRIYLAEGSACPDNLIVLLKLDETSGPMYADHYGDHNAVASVSPTATTGKINGGQLFNATTKIDIPDNGTEFDWLGTSSFSFECWIKTTTKDGMIALARNRIDYTTAASWWIGTNISGYAAFELRDNGSHNCVLSGTKLLNDGNWHHILAVRNGSAKVNKLFVDGVEEASASMDYTNSFIADNPTEINVGYMHRASSGFPEYHFLGSIDEVAIYNRAVSASEATSFYNAGSPTGHCAIGNYAPVFSSEPVIAATEDIAYSYTITANDIDINDVLTLSAITKPEWLTFNWIAGQKTATLTGTPDNSNVGDNNVALRVSDGHVQVDQSFAITVNNVNDPPVVTSVPVTTVNENQAYSYTLTVTDSDASDVIGMTAVTKPSWLSFGYIAGAKTGTLTGTPGSSDIGSEDIDISISDGNHTIHHTYALTVIDVSNPPVISAQVDLSTDEDQSIIIEKSNFTITDVDNPITDITLKVQSGSNYTYVGNTVTPSLDFNGQLTVNVIASDLNDDSQVFQAVITVNAVNDAPVVTSTPVLSIYVGNLYAYILRAADVDNVTLIKSVVQKPDWLTFSATAGLLTGTPVQANKGQHSVILRVSDGQADTDQEFTITVDGPNGLPDLEAYGIHIYPLPARDYITVQFGTYMEESQLEVISTAGNIIKIITIPANQDKLSLDLTDVEAGQYILHFSNNSLNTIGRIVVIK